MKPVSVPAGVLETWALSVMGGALSDDGDEAAECDECGGGIDGEG
jgi:hypothetical protein